MAHTKPQSAWSLRSSAGVLLDPTRPQGPPGAVLGTSPVPVGKAKDCHVPPPVPKVAPVMRVLPNLFDVANVFYKIKRHAQC